MVLLLVFVIFTDVLVLHPLLQAGCTAVHLATKRSHCNIVQYLCSCTCCSVIIPNRVSLEWQQEKRANTLPVFVIKPNSMHAIMVNIVHIAYYCPMVCCCLLVLVFPSEWRHPSAWCLQRRWPLHLPGLAQVWFYCGHTEQGKAWYLIINLKHVITGYLKHVITGYVLCIVQTS